MTDKRVPREPTRAMVVAGKTAYEFAPVAGGILAWLMEVWRAMYDAAPRRARRARIVRR